MWRVCEAVQNLLEPQRNGFFPPGWPTLSYSDECDGELLSAKMKNGLRCGEVYCMYKPIVHT